MRRFLLLLLCLSVAACFTNGKRGGDASSKVFDLGSAVERKVDVRKFSLAGEVRMPSWLDTPGINYRLLYAEPQRLREYAQARWVGSPAQLIQLRLIQDLGMQTVGQGGGNCLLRVEVDEFAQFFDSPENSRAVLRGRVLWLGRTRQLLAEMPVSLELAASSPDSAGGVAALGNLVSVLGQQISVRESAWSAAGKLDSCAN